MSRIPITSNVEMITNIVKVDEIKPFQLASHPWPADGSRCGVCTVYGHPDVVGNFMPFMVWGEYDGDASRKRYLGQQGCVEASPANQVKRFWCPVSKGLPTGQAPPEGDGLFIGLVDAATMSDINKLHDPGQWWWAGYLADLPTSQDFYYLSIDINKTWPDPGQAMYLIFITNAAYFFGGIGATWRPGGYGFSGGVRPDLDMVQFNLNEPGDADGWEILDSYFDLTYVQYLAGSGQLWEGFCKIASPVFPGTATEGTPYEFAFTQTNENAFPCGCPETIVWQLFDRDSGNPLGDPVTYALECGYSGLNWSGSLHFSGGGTFHGQLAAGHLEGTSFVVDDTYDFDVVITPLPCSNWTTSTECWNHGCYWWNGYCRDYQPTYCSDLNNQYDCELWGCYWWGGACHGAPPCSDYTTESTCVAQNCYWWSGSCHDTHPTECNQLNNQSDCTAYGCYWYDGLCHSTPADLCQWIIDHGGASGLDVAEVFIIIDSYVFQSPPSGYSFVPTLQQVFGVIDYYLGFDGDAKTGCDLY